MELTSRMKMARFQTFWIQMRNNQPDKSRKTGQTSETKMPFYIKIYHNCNSIEQILDTWHCTVLTWVCLILP
ncbi:hypothetical protein Hanom_Chr13g01229101 [Helianthus anomalus]